MDNNPRRNMLIAKFLDGAGTPGELAELKELLLHDDSAADAFAVAVRFDVLLSEHFSDEAAAHQARQLLEKVRDDDGRPPLPPETRPAGLRPSVPRPARIAAAALLSLLLMTAGWIALSTYRDHGAGDHRQEAETALSPPASGPGAASSRTPLEVRDGVRVGVIRRLIGARFSRNGFDPSVGDPFRTGLYGLTAGILEIVFEQNPEIIVQAPCEFEVKGHDVILLHHGKLSAKVPKGSGDFTIETPSATVVDKGTEFAVEVDDQNGSEVHVFDGTVSFAPKSAGTSDPAILRGRRASMVGMKSASPCGIDVDQDKFLRNLDEPETAYSRLILSWNPVVYYRMNPVGGSLRDSGPLGIDASIVRGESGGTPWASGRIGAALQLGGPSSKDYAVVPDYPKTKNGTLSGVAWVFARSRPRSGTIAKNWAGDEHGQFHFGLRFDDGDLEIYISDGEGREVFAHEGVPLPIGQWQHVAFVADGSMLRLYRNGAEVAATPYAGIGGDPSLKVMGIGVKLNPDGSQPDILRFKNDDPRISDYWHGRIDELALFNHPLTAEQIRLLYESVE